MPRLSRPPKVDMNKKKSMVEHFKEDSDDRVFSCFYDISLRDVCVVSGVGYSTIKRFRAQRNELEWPFMMIKAGTGGDLNWTSVEERRKAMIQSTSCDHLRQVLEKASSRARLMRLFHDPTKKTPVAPRPAKKPLGLPQKVSIKPLGSPQKVSIKPLITAQLKPQIAAQEQPVKALVLPPMVTSELGDMILDKLPTVDDSDYLSWIQNL